MSVLTKPRPRRAKAERKARRRSYLAAADRREQILGVARQVFARLGYHRANIADICAEAGIGRGTLYQYFANKREVLFAVVDDTRIRVEAVLHARPSLAGVRGLGRIPDPQIVAFCSARLRMVLDAVFQDEATLRLVMRDGRGLDGAVDRVLARLDDLLAEAIESDVRVTQKAGLMRAIDPGLAAHFVLGGMEKLVLRALAGNTPVDLDALVNAMVELQLFGLLRRERVSR